MRLFSGKAKKEAKRRNQKYLQLLNDAYNECAKEPQKHLSTTFRDYINWLAPEVPGHNILPHQNIRNPRRVAMLSGYFLRCAEIIVGVQEANEPDDKIKTILNSDLAELEKTKEIANYLDDHDKLGLQEMVSNYSLVPFEPTATLVLDIAEAIYQENELPNQQGARMLGIKLSKDDKDEARELIYRNVPFGYLFKLSEGLVGVGEEKELADETIPPLTQIDQVPKEVDQQAKSIPDEEDTNPLPDKVESPTFKLDYEKWEGIKPWDRFFVEMIEQGLGGPGCLSGDERDLLLTPLDQLLDFPPKIPQAQMPEFNDRCITALTTAYKQETTGKNKDAALIWNEFNKNLYAHSECVVTGIVQNWYLSEGRSLEKKVVGIFSKPDW